MKTGSVKELANWFFFHLITQLNAAFSIRVNFRPCVEFSSLRAQSGSFGQSWPPFYWSLWIQTVHEDLFVEQLEEPLGQLITVFTVPRDVFASLRMDSVALAGIG